MTGLLAVKVKVNAMRWTEANRSLLVIKTRFPLENKFMSWIGFGSIPCEWKNQRRRSIGNASHMPVLIRREILERIFPHGFLRNFHPAQFQILMNWKWLVWVFVWPWPLETYEFKWEQKENAKMHLQMVFRNFCMVHITVKVNHFHVCHPTVKILEFNFR